MNHTVTAGFVCQTCFKSHVNNVYGIYISLSVKYFASDGRIVIRSAIAYEMYDAPVVPINPFHSICTGAGFRARISGRSPWVYPVCYDKHEGE